jgi:hypothetical protein
MIINCAGDLWANELLLDVLYHELRHIPWFFSKLKDPS